MPTLVLSGPRSRFRVAPIPSAPTHQAAHVARHRRTRGGPPATNGPHWHECCASCSAGALCGVAECDDAATPSPQKTALRPDLEGAGGAADADEAVDGMNVFSELIDVLGTIHVERPGSGEKLERAARADCGIMDDVKLIADHWLRLSEDKKNLPDPITEADRRRRDRLRKNIVHAKGEELASRVLPKAASARMPSGRARSRAPASTPRGRRACLRRRRRPPPLRCMREPSASLRSSV